MLFLPLATIKASDDPVHFARLFRCRFDVTPREVRASNELSHAAAP
jgi:hypothetical protein